MLHAHPGMSEAASPYLSIVAMLVESYSLDAAWSLASALSYALGSPSQIMLVTNDSTIKVCDLAVRYVISFTHLEFQGHRLLPCYLSC